MKKNIHLLLPFSSTKKEQKCFIVNLKLKIMYTGLLHTHNLLRWLVLLTALVAVILAVAGWSGKKEWTRKDNLAGLLLTIFVDLQLVIGLILYVISPLTKIAFSDFGAAMKNPVYRFFAVEHIFIMLIALVLIHVGRAKSKKAIIPAAKHKSAAIWYGIALILFLAGIPWDRALQ